MSRRIVNVNFSRPAHLPIRWTPAVPMSSISQTLQRLLRLLTVTLALSVITVGVGVIVRAVVTPDVTAQIGDAITIDQVQLIVATASWVAEHKHTDDTNEISLASVQLDGAVDASSGYAMPAAMMPGMPEEGLRRLRMVVTLTNAGDRSQTVSAADFAIVAANGQSWRPLASTSFRNQHLAPRQTVEGVLFADIPADTPDLTIVWTRNTGAVRLPVGAAPSHDPNHP